MNRRSFWPAVAIMATLCGGAAQAQINGIKTNARVFNDFTTTNLVINNGNSVNAGPVLSTVTVNESGWVNDGVGGNFANRHDFTLSSNNGATNHFFSINDSYSVKALVNLADGSNAPRKEAGFRIDSGITGDAHFIVNSDAGEIVAFGGGAPFYRFGQNSDLNGYTPGTTILMGYTMRAFGDGNAIGKNTIEYFIDRLPGVVGGEATSGQLGYDNLEGGPINYNVSMYVQAAPNLTNPNEFVNTSFSDIMYSQVAGIPEPATLMMSLIALGGMAFVRRQRVR